MTQAHKTDAARKIIRSLNADAEIVETNYSSVNIEKIMDTGLFDYEKALTIQCGQKSFTVLLIMLRRKNMASALMFIVL